MLEPIIEPDSPVVDAHHHLWFHRHPPAEGTWWGNPIARYALAGMRERLGAPDMAVASASRAEKAARFSLTARRVYRLDS
jgi:hypothetical protein